MDSVSRLLQFGADIEAEDRDGKTALNHVFDQYLSHAFLYGKWTSSSQLTGNPDSNVQ